MTAYQTILLWTKTSIPTGFCWPENLDKSIIWLQLDSLLFKAREAFQAKYNMWKEDCSTCSQGAFNPHLLVKVSQQNSAWAG